MYPHLIKPLFPKGDYMIYFGYLTLSKMNFTSKSHILSYCWQNIPESVLSYKCLNIP